MRKIIVLIALSLIVTTTFAQKKKSSKEPKNGSVLAKSDNLAVEVKAGNFQLTINDNGKAKDAIIIKAADVKFAPTNCKLTAFTANGTKLYLLTWTELTQNKTDLKTEDITIVYSNIYEIGSKKLVFSNVQSTNHIVEKVFLDRLKQASETQEKMRREGFEFTLNPDGSVTQKNKTQENKLVYDVAKIEYIDVKRKK